MMKSIDNAFAFQEKALALRGYRQQLLASNIANADTPNYKAMDVNFSKALSEAQGGMGGSIELAATSPGHLTGGSGTALGIKPMYRTAVQPSIDGNTVDMNVEQAQFSDNSLHYLTTLQFINGKIQSTLLALKGN